MKSTRRHAIAAAISMAAAFASGLAWAADGYPAKQITLVVAYPAGGDTDALARLFAEKLSARVGQTVLVDNRPGASGIIGSAYVSKAAPDGYTLLLAPSTFSIAQLVLKTNGSGYDVLNGFTPIVQTGSQPLFLVAGGNSGLSTLKDAVAAAKGGKSLSYASPGSGSPMHILGEMFARASGASLAHVPYKGVAPAINDVLGGHVPVTFVTLGPVAPYLAGGKLRPLAVASAQRSPLAPNVPTLAEQGYKDVEVTAWNGLWGPRNLPPEIVKTLNGHFNEILKMPEIVSRMAVLGTTPVGGDADVLGKTNAADYARFGKVIKELGIQAD
ncbi:Bug family tripartite tricarboxylate transporter substrate binding protein [Variovorax atrisoli]|uniref:Bug family tripartite tricarboxylate transporter substrate binding protein n=1 Tax=Variovorax atrisoli TaxID=3394203 RepID=UPI00160A096E|nr:tripartite tricarboxylate transporter substrate binding protein [Variovorax sp. BK613]MBB3638085.1 tripartite-type tricarboxylate transporter receptor subunit TctC [Variovorax sp. BK613]